MARPGRPRIKVPGYVIGQQRAPGSSPPPTGNLALRFDGRASVSLAVSGLPATNFGDPTTGPTIAAAIGTALARRCSRPIQPDDGWHIGETKSLSLVEDVQGSVVLLTRPISGAFGRGRAIVYQDESARAVRVR